MIRPSSPALLVVEDEMLVLAVVEEALAEAGYDVVTAADARAALESLDADAKRFAGVITDIRLGGGADGWEVAHRARQLSPEVQIVYMTGDSGHDWRFKGVPNSVMVPKPFAVAQIVTAISSLLVREDARKVG